MAGKGPRKPHIGKPPVDNDAARTVTPAVLAKPAARRAPVARPLPAAPVVDAPVVTAAASPVAIAAVEVAPVAEPIIKRAAPKPVAPKRAPEAPVAALHKPTSVTEPVQPAVEEPVPAPAQPVLSETPAEAPAAPTPESQAVAVAAPAVVEPAAVAAEPEIVAPVPAPAVAVKKDIIMETIETTAAKTETMFADMNSRAKTAMEKTQKIAEEMGDFHKGNFEAVVESAKIYAKGVEAMGQDAAEFGRRSFEQMTAALKSMAQVKTPAELMKLHADYVRSSFDAAVAEGSKTTEAVIKLAGDVAQPVSSRFAVVAEKVKAAA
jgi:phasin family protein